MQVASCVIELQQRLPQARVLYCSATGVSEVGNMAYMTRMGLWGQCTAFPDFESFLNSMKRRGVSFMEMLAMEMKAEGKYVARGLSFRCVLIYYTSQQHDTCRSCNSLKHSWETSCTPMDAPQHHRDIVCVEDLVLDMRCNCINKSNAVYL